MHIHIIINNMYIYVTYVQYEVSIIFLKLIERIDYYLQSFQKYHIEKIVKSTAHGKLYRPVNQRY